jgi:phage protein|nr:MAG TPA: tail protein [Caudoviricetes sp.]
MTEKARTARLKASYDGKNITADIARFFKSFSISEAMSGEADSASVTMHDRPELWIGEWLPDRGATIEIGIVLSDWKESGDTRELPLGKFELDEIENSGPPYEAKLKLISIPNNAEIRGVYKTHAWEKTKLSAIAKDIADAAKLELYYDTEDDPILDRAEQSEQTDLSFLLKLCKDAGLALKVTDEKIVIFDIRKFEEAEPVRTVKKNAVMSFSAKTTIHDIYKACHVKYKHSKQDEFIEYTFADSNKSEGMTLEVNEKVSSIEEAEKLAKKKLREKNSEEVQVSVTVPGDFSLMASNTVILEGFHKYDGKFIIIKSSHEIGTGGYTTKIELRRCIDGY